MLWIPRSSDIMKLMLLLNLLVQLNHAFYVPSQIPLGQGLVSESSSRFKTLKGEKRKLTGRFLHITDIHPDPFYKIYSGTDAEEACHQGSGPAGYYGAETTDCDSPYSLMNATFDWIEQNLKGTIDFVIWTGDSARHDNDEEHPRDEKQVLDQNIMLVDKFNEVFGKDENRDDPDPTNDFLIPIIPTFGNNDILPHNILSKGPNKWTKKYAQIWRQFIPEEQRHGFDRGGWFYVEVLPNKLAVFSLNTMYFFDKNSAVDGCASKGEPGYEHMEWLRIQLEFIRQRNMKAIITGHVPPARTEAKANWDETCWQKYTLWMQQYRDVVVGSIYGHMNIDHFILQDFKDVDVYVADGSKKPTRNYRNLGKKVSTQSDSEYFLDLRKEWSKIPNPPSNVSPGKKKKGKKSEEEKFLDKIGGPWGERYAVSHVSASVVPNFFPSLRVFEYNLTGIEDLGLVNQAIDYNDHSLNRLPSPVVVGSEVLEYSIKNVKGEKHKKKKPKKPNFRIPRPPSKSSAPGPAYSPQTLSWLGYTQFYANITYINHDFDRTSLFTASSFLSLLNPTDSLIGTSQEDRVIGRKKSENAQKWKPGKHPNKKPHSNPKPNPRNFTYDIEFDTRDDGDIYGFSNDTGLCLRPYIELAARLGEFDPKKASRKKIMKLLTKNDAKMADTKIYGIAPNKKKERRREEINKIWFNFIHRAFVGAIEYDDLKDMFGKERLSKTRIRNARKKKYNVATDLK